jgi:hypothetical protein
MKFALPLLAFLSFNSFAAEVSPAELRQLLNSADNMQMQLDSLRGNITKLMNRGSANVQTFSGSCGTDRFATVGGDDCADLDAVLRRPRLSFELRRDIEGAISCAQSKALEECIANSGGYCDVLPGYKSEKIQPTWTGDVNYKCKVTAQARAR